LFRSPVPVVRGAKPKPAKRPVLPRIRPMRLRLVKEPFDHPDYIFELKDDGFRAVTYGKDLFDEICRRDLEGIVAKRKSRSTRTTAQVG
jgi:ATP-dependent DNA ligase